MTTIVLIKMLKISEGSIKEIMRNSTRITKVGRGNTKNWSDEEVKLIRNFVFARRKLEKIRSDIGYKVRYIRQVP